MDRTVIEHCPNPKCGKPIWNDHSDSWCNQCGEPFPEEVRARLPELQRIAEAAEKSKAKMIEDAARPPSRTGKIVGTLVGLATFGLAGLFLSVATGAFHDRSTTAGVVFTILGLIFAYTAYNLAYFLASRRVALVLLALLVVFLAMEIYVTFVVLPTFPGRR